MVAPAAVAADSWDAQGREVPGEGEGPNKIPKQKSSNLDSPPPLPPQATLHEVWKRGGWLKKSSFRLPSPSASSPGYMRFGKGLKP